MGLEDEASRMIWEGGPDKPVSTPNCKNSSFPERRGRIRQLTVAITAMDWESGMQVARTRSVPTVEEMVKRLG